MNYTDTWNNGFQHGIIWSCARLIEMFDQPTIARELYEQTGLQMADLRKADAADKKYIAILRRELRHAQRAANLVLERRDDSERTQGQARLND